MQRRGATSFLAVGLAMTMICLVSAGIGLATEPERRNLTASASNDRSPRWSPDGSRILFESDRDGDWEIFVMAADGTGVEQLTNNDAADRFPAWSPDGRMIVFQSDRAGGGIALYNLDLDSSAISTLAAVGGEEAHPDWSPDGRWVAFTSVVEDDLELFLVHVEHQELWRLTESAYRDVWPRWSPDGSWILFFSRHDTAGEDDELYLIRPDGSERRRITSKPGHDFCPTWAPDGQRIASASRGDDFGRGIAIFDLAGDLLHVVATGFERVTMPDISPDGALVVYTARREDAFDIYVERLPE